MNLIEKYIPETLKDIVGNKKTYDTLLKDLEKSKYKGKYLLTGKSGTAKTTFVKILSKTKKLKIINIKMSDIKTRGDIDSDKNTKVKHLFKRSIKKKIILIDDVDLATNVAGIRNPIESKLKILSKYISKDKYNLIFIISTENKKSIFKTYEGLKTFTLKKIMDKTLYKFIEKVLKNEKVVISEKTKDTIINKILKNGEGNVRKILTDLEMLINGKNKLKYSSNNKELLKKSNTDKKYNNFYDIISDSFKPCDLNDSVSINKKHNTYYADSFIVPAAVYEYYPKGENCKDINVLSEIIESISDADVLNGMRRDCDFGINKYITYSDYMKPTQMMGKVKSQLFFPSNVSRQNKIRNNCQKLRDIKVKYPEIRHHSYSEIMQLYQLEKSNKVKKKSQIVPHSELKAIISLV